MAGERRTVEKQAWPTIGMTVEETADALRVNVRTILDLLNAGKFPGRKVGNGWRISPASVDAWLASGMGEKMGRARDAIQNTEASDSTDGAE